MSTGYVAVAEQVVPPLTQSPEYAMVAVPIGLTEEVAVKADPV